MVEAKRPTLRIQEHIDKLRSAGLDTQMFFDALVGIRDDAVIKKDQRDALYKLVAMEGFVWYLEALRGKPVDRIALAEKVGELAQENAAAIKKRSPGDTAAALLGSDLEPQPRTPPAAAETKLDRPAPRPRKAAPRAAPRASGPGRAAPRAGAPKGGPTRVDRPPRPRKK